MNNLEVSCIHCFLTFDAWYSQCVGVLSAATNATVIVLNVTKYRDEPRNVKSPCEMLTLKVIKLVLLTLLTNEKPSRKSDTFMERIQIITHKILFSIID